MCGGVFEKIQREGENASSINWILVDSAKSRKTGQGQFLAHQVQIIFIHAFSKSIPYYM